MAKSNTAKSKIVLIVSVALNVLTLTYFTSRFIYYRYFSMKPDLVFAQKQKQQWANLVNMPLDTNSIIFSGTSLTQNFPLHLAFNNSHIKNAGLAWSQTRHALMQVKKLIEKDPHKVFLETGINDLEGNVHPDTIFDHFVKIAQTVASRSPHTRLYVQSVFPASNAGLNSRIAAYNNRINNYCQLHHITYINLYPLFLKAGIINSELSVDGVHLNEKDYCLWQKGIELYVAE